MKLPAQLQNSYLIGMIAALLVLFVWDFSTRVWLPVNADSASINTHEYSGTLASMQFEQYPEFLQRWMQQQSAAQPNEEELERQRRVQEQERLQPMEGATELGTIRLRVRAVFTRTREHDSPLQLALAEQQDIETGEVTRVVLRRGDVVGGYQVVSIGSRVVTLTNEQPETIELQVFTFD